MLKRGLIFLILVILLSIAIFNVNKEDITGNPIATPSDTCVTEPTPQFLWDIYSKIPLYSGNNEQIIKAALEGWNVWTTFNPGRVTKTRAEIESGLRRIAGGSGACIDDYSLNSKDDCWNQDALCIEGSCVKFEDIGWDNPLVRTIKNFKNFKGDFDFIVPDEKIKVYTSKLNEDKLNLITLAFFKIIIDKKDIEDETSIVRVSISLLENLKTEKVANFLLDLSKDNNHPSYRIDAISVLEQFKDERIIPIAINILENSKESQFLKGTAASILIGFNSQEGLSSILNQIRNSDQEESLREHLVLLLEDSKLYDIVIPELIKLSRLTPSDTASLFGRLVSRFGVGSKESDSTISFIRENSLSPVLENIISDLRNDREREDSDELIQYAITELFKNLESNPSEREERNIITILLENIDFDSRIRDKFNNLIFRVPLGPDIIHYSMVAGVPLFREVRGLLVSEFEELPPNYELNSMNFAVYRYLLKNYGENPTSSQIISAIEFIKSKRKLFEEQVILGPETYFLTFAHEDPDMISQPIIDFARDRGVKGIYTTLDLKGSGKENEIKEAIINTGNEGKTTIWVNTHGLPNYVCLGGGVPNKQGNIDEESCLGFRYNEFADILLQRRNLNEVVLIIDECFSYNFAEQLIENLKEKNSQSLPTIITETNKGQYGYLGKFLSSLAALELQKGEPLLGRHIYDAEKYSYYKQDSAVFFSEGPNYNEIALNNINHEGCIVCEGDSCPIEPAQGIAS